MYVTRKHHGGQCRQKTPEQVDRLHDRVDLDTHAPTLAAGLLKGLPQDQFEQLRQRFMQRVDELFPSKRQRIAKKRAANAGKLPSARHAASASGCLSHLDQTWSQLLHTLDEWVLFN